MPRLPEPGKDAGQWGSILNEYLSTSLDTSGNLKTETVGAPQLKSNAVTNAAIAGGISATKLADGSIEEAKLSSTVRDKLNATTADVVTSVATKTGDVVLDKADVGLTNVDNTSDVNKPISTAVQAALDTKQASGMYAAASPRGPMIAAITDSIGSYSSASTSAFTRIGPLLSGNRIWGTYVVGIGGYTLDQIRTEVLPGVIPWGPTHILAAGGTNDMNGSVSNAIQAFLRMEAAILSVGAIPIVWTPPPRGAAAGVDVNAKTAQYAAWVRAYGNRKGYRVLDAHSILADPVTGNLPATWAQPSDPVHPNALGHHVLGRSYADLLSSMFPLAPNYMRSPLDPSLTASWGLFLNDSNGDGRADGVGGYGTYTTMAIVPGAPAGNWQEYSGPAGASVPGGALRVDIPGIIPGNQYEMSLIIEADVTGFETGSGPGATFEWRSATGSIRGAAAFASSGAGFGVNIQVEGHVAGERFYPHAVQTAPAGADRLRVDFTRTGGIPTKPWYVRVACVTVRDLTALGPIQ